jgi:hypothetical protein
MKIKIVLNDEDKKYARRHDLTDSEMRDFKEDMEMADAYERYAIYESERIRAEVESTPQYRVYDAW